MADFNIKAYYNNLSRIFRQGPTVPHRIANKTAGPGEFVGSPTGTAIAYLRSSTNSFASHMAHYGNYSRLSRYADYCITGDMLVITNTEQGYLTMRELVERFQAGETIHTYAYDNESRDMVFVPVRNAWKTKRDIIWEITFDDGLVLRCTGDHKVMLRDGTYKQAQKLEPNDAVMPFHRKAFDYGQRCAYRWVYCHGRKKWVTEHRLVMESVHGRGETVYDGKEIHHKNFRPSDNRLENLVLLGKQEHRTYHRRLNNSRYPRPGTYNAGREDQKGFDNANADKNFSFEDICAAYRPGMTLPQLTEATGKSSMVTRARIKWAGYKSYRDFALKHANYTQSVSRLDNPNAHSAFTFQNICNAYVHGMSMRDLCRTTRETAMVITKRLKWEGYRDFADFTARYSNHKVVSVVCTGQQEDVYDLTIDKYHNFAVGQMVGNSLKSLIISNCEMETMAEIASALDIYSHEVCAKGEYGEILKIQSNNPEIKDALTKLFYDTLNIEFNAAAWIRSLCKYGDYMLLIDHHPDFGVVNVFPMPINEVEREEGFDPENPTRFRYRWTTHNNKLIEPWQVLHFRLLGNDSYLPYGMSILEAARRAWRQLILMEDAVMVYRIVRSPERRVFYLDVGNIAPNNVEAAMNKAKDMLKRNQVVDPTSGQVDLRYNALPVHWSTPIPLLDGRTISIKELANEYDEGKTNWVYSIQDKSLQLVPGKVVWCGRNYVAKKLAKVTLDDGTHMLTAPEHPFVMRDGTSKRADELKPMDSLMPLYRNINSLNYESCYNPATTKNTRTHSWVAKDIYPKEISETPDFVVHHKEFWKGSRNKLDNSPANLQIMERHDHSRLHIEHCKKHLNSPEQLALRAERFTRINKTQEHIQQTIERNKKLRLAQRMGRKYNGSDLHKQHNEIRKEAQSKSWGTDKASRSRAMRWNIPQSCLVIAKDLYKNNCTLPRDEFIKVFRSSPEIKSIVTSANPGLARDFNKLSRTVFEAFISEHGYKTFGDFKTECTGRIKNHKVSSVEIIDADAEVYCMTVTGNNGEDDRHNFAAMSFTANGESSKSAILLRNSVEEDYFIPVRGQDTGTKIDTLPGGQFPIRRDSIIPLLDGRKIPIEQLAQEYREGKENWVYSVQDKTHQLVPGRVAWCGKNYHCDNIHRVWLDDGSYVDMAPEHPIVMRDGASKKASEVNPGDSVMPFRLKESGKKERISGYAMVQNPSDNKYHFVHRIVAENIGGKDIALSKSSEKTAVVHHVDFDKNNNSPVNLRWMGFFEHRNFHISMLSRTLHSEKTKAKCKTYTTSEQHKALIKSKANDPSHKLNKWIQSKENKKRCGQLNYVPHINAATRQRNSDRWHDKKFRDEHSGNNHWLKRKWTQLYQQYTLGDLKSFCVNNNIFEFKHVYSHKDCFVKTKMQLRRFFEYHGILTWRQFRRQYLQPALAPHNHKISHVEILKNVSDDVYCMTVIGPDGEDDRHNFAVESVSKTSQVGVISGVFLKNTGDIDDLQYMQNKLFAALKIPKSYLGYESDISGKSTLAQEDVRFARTIQHIQRIFLAELEKAAMIQLYSMGYRDEDLLNFELSMANPSTINEIQRLELWRTRFEVASLATGQDGVLDKRFIYRHIFRLSEEDIENIEEGRRQDKLIQIELEQMDQQVSLPIEPDPDDEPMRRGRDPNVQRAMPNDMLGRAAKTTQEPDSVVNRTYNLKKNGMDPEKELQLLRRQATAPFGENFKQKADAIFQKRIGLLNRYNNVIKSMENLNIGGNAEKKPLND